MSEMNKPNEELVEQNIVSTPEQAVNAATSELSTEQSNAAEQPVEVESAESTKPDTRQEIIERLQQIAAGDDVLNCKNEAESLKVHFYKLRTAEIDEERKAFVASGGEENLFIPSPDELEESFKAAMNQIKEKRSSWLKAQEEEMQANYETKMALLKELQELVDKAEQGTPEVNEFRTLQNRWREIKNIPQDKVTPSWKQYQLLVEQFYDVLKLNNEFREYDFKKNLEIKTRLCEAAEALTGEEDIINAFRQLQQLHNEFREAGPVAPELREEIWNRFKAASTTVNRRHQEHFENKKEKERINLEQKTAICEEIEAIDPATLTTYQAWNNETEKILALQARWKEIGFAPQKMNLKIFERFRGACDEFFKHKSEFFKSIKSQQVENLERKRLLCEAAEALKESEDWKATADKLTKMQKEWKEIGAVPQKYSEALWKRFVSACDEFFEKRNKATSSQRNAEHDNLKLKRAIIEQIKAIDESLNGDEQIKQINELSAQWNTVGFVPFKEKDKIHKEFRAAINTIYERLHVNANERKLANFRNNIAKGGNSLTRERERLIRQYESLKNEIATYENNLGFLSTSNKKGESLVDVMRQKMEKLKGDAEVILKKIHLIEDEIEKQEQ
ncbi:MAG: DUF349 domain-containing protein [Bacteroidaceae bacterium]|nr:DUF349 domain-containing protein [Bacteroidaceae bacterium]